MKLWILVFSAVESPATVTRAAVVVVRVRARVTPSMTPVIWFVGRVTVTPLGPSMRSEASCAVW